MKKLLMIGLFIAALTSFSQAQECIQWSDEILLYSSPLLQCACAYLCPGMVTEIVICEATLGPNYPPLLTIRAGCYDPDRVMLGCMDESCPPAEFSYNPDGWVFNPTTWCWSNTITGLSIGCVCICVDDFLPVELVSFAAVSGEGKVILSWQTASETRNNHFEIIRDHAKIADVATLGTSASGHSYIYEDRNVTTGTVYSYELVSVDEFGNRRVLDVQSGSPMDNAGTVTDYALYQNYPNPFNPSTQIRFDLAESGPVTLTIYNPVGQEIATLVNASLSAGTHTVNFDARDMPTGMYLYRLEAGSFTAVRKMMLMK